MLTLRISGLWHREARVGAPGLDEAAVPSRKGGFGKDGNIILKDGEEGQRMVSIEKTLSLNPFIR